MSYWTVSQGEKKVDSPQNQTFKKMLRISLPTKAKQATWQASRSLSSPSAVATLCSPVAFGFFAKDMVDPGRQVAVHEERLGRVKVVGPGR